METYKERRIGAVLSYISRGLGIAIGILYTPIMIRLLGQDDFGLYNLVAAVIASLGVLNFGFDSSYVHFFSKYKIKNDQAGIAALNGQFTIIYIFISLLVLFAGFIITENLNLVFGDGLTMVEMHKMKIMVLLLIFNMFFRFNLMVFSTYITANQRFIFQNIIAIINQISSPLISLPVLLAGYGSIGLVLVTVLVNVVTLLANVIYCFTKLNIKFIFNRFDKELFISVGSYSFFIFLNMVVDQINNELDKVILGRYRGTLSVAIYSVGEKISLYYTQMSTVISQIFTPKIHQMIGSNDYKREINVLFNMVGRIQFFILILVASGFVIFGQEFINIWAGDGYEEAYQIALILIIPLTIPLIQNVGIEIQRSQNKHQFRSIVLFIIAIFNVVLTIPLSQIYGGLGAAIGTSLSLLIGNGLIINIYYHKNIGLDIIKFWQNIFSTFPALLLPFLIGGLIHYFVTIDSLILLGVYGLIYALCFCASVWCFALNASEKQLLKQPFN
ncbi:lipopolysaccharide biosynthesis protein [Aerococcus kribbianus]|uniref:Oligosaccharide flippase family protein n=1 Tax=Aerococcus kribbianus TaxID=2999064 RepID=A0A9X3FNT5_9LACT|nr:MULTISPECIES: oligosaccharide flippase family protein [unclassified Aerococcus]MCZ0717173.1 oligosaccharide flippase family protein [Aerococcus sp. YH-aer221]MCZ0725461.1 oligosaccharide flippase family protein [Aerococcus sp. YH-aer222]